MKMIQILLKYKLHLIFIGSFIGFISWSFEDIRFTIFSIFIFYAYIHLNKRLDFIIVVFCYLLVSSRGLLIGTITYYDETFYGLIVWFGSSLIILIPYSLIWSRKKNIRYLLLPLLIIVLILPPFGFVSWVNPIINAALIFPGLGFFGLLLFLCSFYAAIFLPKYQRMFFISILSIFIITNKTTPVTPNDIQTLNSNYDYDLNQKNFEKDYFRQLEILERTNKSSKNILVASENILGYYNSNSGMIWDQVKDNKTLYAGAYIKNKLNPNMFDNVVMSITAEEKKVIYKQRVPILVSMWKPWSNEGAKAYLFDNPIVKVDNKLISFFVCYEQNLDFTFLHSAAYDPDLFIGISNLWWAKDTTIETIQHNKLKLYSLLFDKPLIYAVNR